MPHLRELKNPNINFSDAGSGKPAVCLTYYSPITCSCPRFPSTALSLPDFFLFDDSKTLFHVYRGMEVCRAGDESFSSVSQSVRQLHRQLKHVCLPEKFVC